MTEIENLLRREVIETARTLVIKVGTKVLSDDNDMLDVARIGALTEQVHRILETGRKVVLVSSGAVGAGMSLLGLDSRPNDLPHLQAAAATGQARLIRHYDDCLQQHGYHAAQLLLTANDFKNRARYLNVRNTLNTLFEYAVVPVINENDSVSIDEIKFGDNDQLAAMVANMSLSPLLIILTSVDGLFDGSPLDSKSRLISLVEKWDDSLMQLARDDMTPFGRGGMSGKLLAVRSVTAVGENVIIANGTRPNVLDDILAGKEVGTLFVAQGVSVPAWKRWIGYTVAPKGCFIVDAGAKTALQNSGRSLLAIGITGVEGTFSKGEVVAISDESGVEFARGLTNYGIKDASAIAGKRTDQISDALGSLPYEEVIHRDNLVLIA